MSLEVLEIRGLDEHEPKQHSNYMARSSSHAD